MEKYLISIDWLQTYNLCNELTDGIYTDGYYSFNLTLTGTETAQFKRLYKLTCKGQTYATIQQCPRTSVINPKTTLVKLDNRVLYSGKCIEILYAINFALSLRYKGISRLDLCYDCNRFYAGRSPARFVKDYLSKSEEETGYIYRVGSSTFTAHGDKAHGRTSVTSIRFGSEKSMVSCYMYDKTKELSEVKDKPWIRECWEAAGLVSDEDTHVWRTEISIRSQGTDILRMSTGELFRLSPRSVEWQERAEEVFGYYAAKYLKFRRKEQGQTSKRYYREMRLFESVPTTTDIRPIKVNTYCDTGRTEKIVANRLKALKEEYSDRADALHGSIDAAITFLDLISAQKAELHKLRKDADELVSMKGKRFIEEEQSLLMETIRQARAELNRERQNLAYYAWEAYNSPEGFETWQRPTVKNTPAEPEEDAKPGIKDMPQDLPDLPFIEY